MMSVEPETKHPRGIRPGSSLTARSEVKHNHADLLIAISFFGDACLILLGLCLGFWIRFRSGLITFGVEAPDLEFGDYWKLFFIGTGFLLLAFGFLRLYDASKLLRYRQAILVILKGTTLWLFAYLGLSLALKFEPPISRIYVVCSYITVMVCLAMWRKLLHLILKREFIARNLRQRVLFVGWNTDADRLTSVIETDPNHPYDVVGCVPSPEERFQQPPSANAPRLGHYSELPDLLAEQCADIVVLADLDTAMGGIISLANLCEKEFVQFKIIPSYFQILVSALNLETISGIPILGVSQLPLDRPVNRILKRTVDIFGSIIGLILSAPIMAFCGLLVYIESPGRIFFSQERIGRNGRAFFMFKIRSMKLGAELTDHLNQSTLREDPRLLRVGRFMRRWNLDEVPQFWNVFRGEMSLVGPRPERTVHSEQLSEKIPHYNARYSSKPGITGWAQVNGLRGDTNLVERVRYDLFYLENWSLWLDLQIMIQTFFKRHNAY